MTNFVLLSPNELQENLCDNHFLSVIHFQVRFLSGFSLVPMAVFQTTEYFIVCVDGWGRERGDSGQNISYLAIFGAFVCECVRECVLVQLKLRVLLFKRALTYGRTFDDEE